MTTQAAKLVTADELFEMGDIGRCELVRGEIIPMAPPGAEHGDISGQLLFLIKSFVAVRHLGKVYAAETGFTIARDPDTTRAPDVAFVRKERLPAATVRKYFPGAPNLAVEVNSPNDRASDVLAKVDEWLAAGTISVWVVDPPTRSIVVYRGGGEIIRYRDTDELRDEPTLPGFAMKLTDVFDAE
jgi:Uma2 family endonuclease